MLPTGFLPALALAERALGRLDNALADPAERRRHGPDAVRRSVLALARLNGALVDEEELALALVAPECIAPGARTAALWCAAVYKLGLEIEEGLHGEAVPMSQQAAPYAAHGLATEGLKAALEGLALLEADLEDLAPSIAAAPAPRPRLDPWSRDGVTELFRRWLALEAHPEDVCDGARDALAQGLRLVEVSLAADPGLIGAARAFHRLQLLDDPPVARRTVAPDEFEDDLSRAMRAFGQATAVATGFWPFLSRLAAPALLRRACGLENAHLPLAAGLARAGDMFRAGLARSEDETIGWLLDRAGQWAENEVAGLSVLARRHELRIAALGPLRRDARAPDLVAHLGREPAVTVASVAAVLGVTKRAARLVLASLGEAAILRGVPAWHQTLDLAEQKPAIGRPRPLRPVAWVAAERAPRPPEVARPRRPRTREEPPPGTPMSWLPIEAVHESALRSRKRLLVWAGRPVIAAFDPAALDGAGAWRDGRRIITPSHYLPIAPPVMPGGGSADRALLISSE